MVIHAQHGTQPLYFTLSRGQFKEDRTWYKNFEYPKEKYRGLDFQEDSYALGSLKVDLTPGERVFLTFSLEQEMASADPVRLQKREITRLKNLIPEHKRNGQTLEMLQFRSHLLHAADQFIVQRKSSGGQTIIAGYHWFTDWGRDTMIAMRGLVIEPGKQELAKSILRTFLDNLDGGMLPNRFPDQGETPEYNTFDATLWLFIVCMNILKNSMTWVLCMKFIENFLQIIEAHLNGTRYNIHVLM